jgi:hypothetical protein
LEHVWTDVPGSVGDYQYRILVRKGQVQLPVVMEGLVAVHWPGAQDETLRPLSVEIRPNPMTLAAEILVGGSSADDSVLEIFGPAGRLVRRLYLSTGAEGSGLQRVVWDRTDERGHTVAAGAYFVSLRQGHVRTGRKLVVVQ